MILESVLVGTATAFLTDATTSTAQNIARLFSKDQLKSVLEKSYTEFRENYLTEGGIPVIKL